MNQVSRFNIRVYSIITNSRGQVLLSHETMGEHSFVKFPGGGLRLGEGLIDGLRREIREECSREIKEIEHYYTTDFFQRSIFRKEDQLISVYYKACFLEDGLVGSDLSPSLVEPNKSQSFRWHALDRKIAQVLTFPVDKKVIDSLLGIQE